MLKKRLLSFKYAYKGLLDLLKNQPNVIIHLTISLLVLIAGFFFHLASIEWGLLVLTIASVLAAEAFNTSLEYLTDLVSPDYHPLAGRVKDVAAAGVLITAVGAAIIGMIIFLPKITSLFSLQ